MLDLEDTVEDPASPDWSLAPGLTCDGVNPNQTGYSAIANAIPLDIFN